LGEVHTDVQLQFNVAAYTPYIQNQDTLRGRNEPQKQGEVSKADSFLSYPHPVHRDWPKIQPTLLFLMSFFIISLFHCAAAGVTAAQLAAQPTASAASEVNQVASCKPLVAKQLCVVLC